MPDYPRPCPRCGELLERDSFAVDRSRASGRKSQCKSCDGERSRRYYRVHREDVLATLKVKREAARPRKLTRAEEHELSRRRIAELLAKVRG